MNGKDLFARIQAGDYEGTRDINGFERKSIFRRIRRRRDQGARGLLRESAQDNYKERRSLVRRSSSKANRCIGGQETAAPWLQRPHCLANVLERYIIRDIGNAHPRRDDEPDLSAFEFFIEVYCVENLLKRKFGRQTCW